MPTHRVLQDRLESIVNARGAVLIFNPPQSPDLNPQEKFWDVLGAACVRRMFELAEQGLRFGLGDLHELLRDCRMSLHCYAKIFNSPENPCHLPFLQEYA